VEVRVEVGNVKKLTRQKGGVMTTYKRHPTRYQGVFYREGTNPRTGRVEKIYYIKYSRDGKSYEDKCGRESAGMTAARANALRILKIAGTELPLSVAKAKKAAEEEAAKAAEAGRYDFDRLFNEYISGRGTDLKGKITDTSRYRLHIAPAFGPKELITIDRWQMGLFQRSLSKKVPAKGNRADERETLSPATITRVLELFKRLWHFGVAEKDFPLKDLAKLNIKMPVVNNLVTEDLTDSQLKALMDALEQAADQDVADVMRVALFLGLRRGEILKLKWSDINFERGFVSLRNPKSGKNKTVPLNSAARAVFEKRPRLSEWVFPSPVNPKNHVVEIRRSVNLIARAAGLPEGWRPVHGLRHFYAGRLVAKGVDIYTVSKLLTHSSVKITERYSHVRDDALRRAAEVAGNLFQTGEAEESSTG
jgi:integrase